MARKNVGALEVCNIPEGLHWIW